MAEADEPGSHRVRQVTGTVIEPSKLETIRPGQASACPGRTCAAPPLGLANCGSAPVVVPSAARPHAPRRSADPRSANERRRALPLGTRRRDQRLRASAFSCARAPLGHTAGAKGLAARAILPKMRRRSLASFSSLAISRHSRAASLSSTGRPTARNRSNRCSLQLGSIDSDAGWARMLHKARQGFERIGVVQGTPGWLPDELVYHQLELYNACVFVPPRLA